MFALCCMLPGVRGHSFPLLCAAQKVSVDPGVSAMGKRVPQTACGAVGAGAGKTVRSRAAAKAKTSAKARAAPKRASAPRARAKPRAVSTAKARTKATAKATRASSARCRGRSSQPSLSDSEESTSGSSSSASSSSCSSDPSSTEMVLVEQPTVGVAIAEHCGRAFGRELAAQAQAPAAQVSFWSTAVSSAPSPMPDSPDSYEIADRSLWRRGTAAPKMLARAGYRCPTCFGLLRDCRPSCKGSEFRGP